MWYVFKANSPAHQSLFQSGWFIEGLLSQTLIVHMIRTRKIPFIQSWATPPVLLLTGAIMAVGIWLPFSGFAPALQMVPLPGGYFPWLIAILLTYCLLTQLVKVWFIQKFHRWL
jgi:Mg2+-importing ATPase